jgi:putative transposase
VSCLFWAWAGTIAGVAFSFLYLAFRALLGAVVRSRRGLDVKDLELLVLRHELEVLGARWRGRSSCRGSLAATARHLRSSARSARLVTPRTLLRWHRALVRGKWRQPPGRRGRPCVPAEVRAVVLRMARENRRWGHGGMSGELAKLGLPVSPSTVRRLLGRPGLGPAPRTSGPGLARVPARPGGEHRRLRLLHRRERAPTPLCHGSAGVMTVSWTGSANSRATS